MDPTYKVMVLGAPAVGKTSIAQRLKFDSFKSEHKATIGVELYSLQLQTIAGQRTIVLWDTDGAFGDRVFENVFIKGADAALIVADIERDETIEHMLNLGGRFAERFPGAPISSLMNKCDRKAASADQLAKAGQVFSTTHQCSARTGEGVLQALNHILGQLASSRA